MTGSAEDGREPERLVGADRVLAVLTELAAHPQGVSLDELAGILHSTKPTVHRALATLSRAGLADRIDRGTYVLGDEYLRLAFRHLDGRPETARVQPLLEALAQRFGETAHYAVLAGTDIVYRAKVDPPTGAVRLTSVVGGRNPAARTAVGKVLLAAIPHALDRFEFPLEQKTPHTLVTRPALQSELELTLARGFAVDDQENEPGVNCLAVPVSLDGSPAPSGAVSVSALSFRTPLSTLVDAVDEIRALVARHLGPGPGAGEMRR